MVARKQGRPWSRLIKSHSYLLVVPSTACTSCLCGQFFCRGYDFHVQYPICPWSLDLLILSLDIRIYFSNNKYLSSPIHRLTVKIRSISLNKGIRPCEDGNLLTTGHNSDYEWIIDYSPLVMKAQPRTQYFLILEVLWRIHSLWKGPWLMTQARPRTMI